MRPGPPPTLDAPRAALSSASAACKADVTARDLLRARADLVAVGSESLRDPAAGLRIAAELDAFSSAQPLAPKM